MATEQQVEEFVEKQGSGEIEGSFGPSYPGKLEVWEVWVHDGNQYQTRFVVEDKNRVLHYFGQFQQFCHYVNGLYGAQNKVSLYVAALVFVASFVVLAVLILARIEPNEVTFGVLASLIASGGYMFFGAWRSP